MDWYMALAFWKLAAIVEGAYAEQVEGKLDARALARDVPALLREAAAARWTASTHCARWRPGRQWPGTDSLELS